MNPSAAFGAFVTSRHASLPTTRSVSEISILQKEKMVQGHRVCQWQAGLAPQRDAGAHAGLISPFRPSFARCPAPALAGRPCPPFQVWVWLEDLPQPQEGPQMERGLAWLRGALPVTPSQEGGWWARRRPGSRHGLSKATRSTVLGLQSRTRTFPCKMLLTVSHQGQFIPNGTRRHSIHLDFLPTLLFFPPPLCFWSYIWF